MRRRPDFAALILCIVLWLLIFSPMLVACGDEDQAIAEEGFTVEKLAEDAGIEKWCIEGQVFMLVPNGITQVFHNPDYDGIGAIPETC